MKRFLAVILALFSLLGSAGYILYYETNTKAELQSECQEHNMNAVNRLSKPNSLFPSYVLCYDPADFKVYFFPITPGDPAVENNTASKVAPR